MLQRRKINSETRQPFNALRGRTGIQTLKPKVLPSSAHLSYLAEVLGPFLLSNTIAPNQPHLQPSSFVQWVYHSPWAQPMQVLSPRLDQESSLRAGTCISCAKHQAQHMGVGLQKPMLPFM